MPIQAPQWTEFLSCPVCYNGFNADARGPVTLGCRHTICRGCLTSLERKQCPIDHFAISFEVSKIPLNGALVKLVGGGSVEDIVGEYGLSKKEEQYYKQAIRRIIDLVLYLKPFSSGAVSLLSRPMQRKLVTLANCQLLTPEGRARAVRAARSLGERTVTELLLLHQNPQQLSANLWAAVRARGCQFLGPVMQEEVLKLVLLALEDGSALSRKVLVMFVVQRLEPHYSQASKTSIGHVVQLLYRASCFKVSKREDDSSLMQLKEEFRSYEALRREHDAQIVQIATEAGLRIAPDQWSALLYGDTTHKSHMQSIMDKLQTPESFSQSLEELNLAFRRYGDPFKFNHLTVALAFLTTVDPNIDAPPPSIEETGDIIEAAHTAVVNLADFISKHGSRSQQECKHGGRPQQDCNHSPPKYKISMCRNLSMRGYCRRGTNCTFAHSESELDKFRSRNRKPQFSESNLPLNSKILPNILASSPANALYDPESYHPNAIPSQQIDSEEFMPYESPLLRINKHGPISRHDLLPFNDTHCLDEREKINELATHRPDRCSPLALQQPKIDKTFYDHTPQNFLTESQLLKHQKRSLERKFMDLNLDEIYEAGIAEDMKELEQRLESELAEQERRWSEADPKPLS